MKEIVFATNNPHKLEEIKQILKGYFKVCGLKEKGIEEDIPEDHDTLEENAFQKAEYIWTKLGESCFADDTGLEIEALDGAPGVYSARYSRMGDPVYPQMEIAEGNIRKVLEKMDGLTNRRARFRTVIALILDGKRFSFEGVAEGSIIAATRGARGFGYDPIFLPEGFSDTFAEMDMELKNQISHRSKAVMKLAEFLTSMDE